MTNQELIALFDQQAQGYDQQWARLAPINGGLYFLLESAFAALPEHARILCVGAGTGREILHLAKVFPRWQFTAVEPAPAMVAVCRDQAEKAGIAARCTFFTGYLQDLPPSAPFDAATSLLVSQFLMDKAQRIGFFNAIAQRLAPGGLLANADLAADLQSPQGQAQLALWFKVMSQALPSADALARMQNAYRQDVAVLPPAQVAALLAEGGFTGVFPFFQAGLIHGWLGQRQGD
ncbi:class I SAM-dependent methyltransferase [Gallaecimonas xiamenensis]|uniref:SAM-dependent methyltransferase n=1 Tax=Gallaecimonas xiamenensis 3-C-1 TaxID=745411 RepID=K2J9Y5_9GAMM|nr:class I SAM-dependent methyltransferase [Gallaecimonas xiamenensis]EKE71617.1 SAM-dependent methyltransferase [Gallaecimonas xiamenensis 3-C-1]